MQRHFADKLSALSGKPAAFAEREWFRNQGNFGGGTRFEGIDTDLFNRASINLSQVHYDSEPEKPLGSATALSAIIHPRNPWAPSIHIHISWTEMKNGHGYWRMMADLNPSIPNDRDTNEFTDCLLRTVPQLAEAAFEQGDQYFAIPYLGRHRGVRHFYLEDFHTDSPKEDRALAESLGYTVIDQYVAIFSRALKENAEFGLEEKEQQLAYHTLYFSQVLLLDRGTTSGLLVHDENDVGILGSLPSHVSPALLQEWIPNVTEPQDTLLKSLIEIVGNQEPAPVSEATKAELAQRIRQHYRAHPEAIEMQARGNVVPPTVQNHQSGQS